jgi:hypothetical protein
MTAFQPVMRPEFLYCERTISLVIPTEPSASGRRGINAERFAGTAEKKESLRGDLSAAVQDDRLRAYGSQPARAASQLAGGRDSERLMLPIANRCNRRGSIGIALTITRNGRAQALLPACAFASGPPADIVAYFRLYHGTATKWQKAWTR